MKDYPVIRIAIAFIIGILLHEFIQLSLISCFIILLFLIILYSAAYYIKSFKKFQLILSLAVLLLSASFGNIYIELNSIKPNAFFSSIHNENDVTISGKINLIELHRSDKIVFYISTDSIRSESFFVIDKLVFLCSVSDTITKLNKIYSELHPGNIISVKGSYYRGRTKRNPGEFDYNKYLLSNNISGILYVNQESDISVIDDDKNQFSDFIFNVRKLIDKKFNELHSKETTALLRGLLLADRSEIDYETKTQFINSGVIHVLAISGLHVGFIAFIFYFLFNRFNTVFRSLLTIGGLLFFLLLTGLPPSVFRATVMAVVISIGFITNRSTNIFNSLAIAAIILLLINPNDIYLPGFQLSFSAVLAIGAIYPIIEKWINRFQIQYKAVRYIILFMGVSFSAQIGTLPFTLIYFGKISIIALFTNLIVIPAIGLIISIAIITLIISVVSTFIASYYAMANELITSSLTKIISFTGDLTFSHLNIRSYSFIDLFVFYFFLILFFFYLPRFRSIAAIAIMLLISSLNIYTISSIDDEELLADNKLNIVMIDVGQGDAFLIKFPNGKTALIDAGGVTYKFDNGERVIMPLLEYFNIDKIDYGFVSHIDNDHHAGFISLILNNKINEIYKPEIDTSSNKDVRFDFFLKMCKIPVTYYNSQKIQIGNAEVFILNNNDYFSDRVLSSNESSGVIKITYGANSIIFTGDAGIETEKIYTSIYKDFLNSDVLKIGHHGSETSSSIEFINTVSPEISLVSAGINNSYGHPADKVISRLKEIGSKIFRTDKEGAVILQSDGTSFKKIVWKN